MYSFALGELGVSSLNKVYKMTWREFQLRLYAYKRQQKEKMLIARQVTYYAGYGVTVPKAKKIDSFWPIEQESKKVSQAEKERMKKAMQAEWAKLKEKHPNKY